MVHNDININKTDQSLYIRSLINKIFKIIPMTEENNYVLPTLYIERLIFDIKSADDLFCISLTNLIIKVNSLITNDLSFWQIKNVIFECISLCTKIIAELEGDKSGV